MFNVYSFFINSIMCINIVMLRFQKQTCFSLAIYLFVFIGEFIRWKVKCVE